jgi:hypothetical protein
MDKEAHIRVYTDRLGDIREIIRNLQVFEHAYNHLYALELIFDDAKRRYSELDEDGYSGRQKTVKTIISIRKPAEVVLPEDRLQISSVVIQSPGFWEFLGNINPLEVLRKYLCDRHERKKDQSYRSRQEEERGDLENERLRIQVVEEKVRVLKEIGVPEEKIRRALFEHVISPLGALDGFQDKGFVKDAEIIHDWTKPEKGPR